jgi:hypothetical protein
MYMLLAIGHVVTAQVAESVEPSLAPSLSLNPSFNPTVESLSPSAEPTGSFLPTVSMAPSSAPSSPMTTDLFNIAMVLEGFPFINAMVNETSTNKTLWEMITSNHVSTYWAQRNYTNFNITAVTTNFQVQVSHFTDEDEESDTATPEEIPTKVVYDQRIIYWVDDPNGPVPDLLVNATNKTILFTRPFSTDSQAYCDNLHQAFNLSDPVFMINFFLIPFETSEPASAPSSPPSGGGSGNTTADGLEGGVVAAIVVVCIAFVVLVLFFGVWYLTHRKEEHIKQDEAVREPGQMVVVNEPPGFRLQDSEYSEAVTNYEPAAFDSHIPEAEEPRKLNESYQRSERQGSL